MPHLLRRAALAAPLLLLPVAGARAQADGLVVRNAGIPTGVGVALDLGFPNAAAGKGLGVGVTGQLGLGPLGVTGTLARRDPSGSESTRNSVAVSGNLKVFGGPLVPLTVTLQAGAGRFTSETRATSAAPPVATTYWHVPVGVGFALTIPGVVLAVKPWLAPRLDLLRTKLEGGTSSTDTDFGVSGGVDLSFLSGLSFRLAYDRVRRGGENAGVLGLGVGYTFKVGL